VGPGQFKRQQTMHGLFHSFELAVPFAPVVSGGDVPAMSVSEADGHICHCCVSW
jgi:hypothetical protein